MIDCMRKYAVQESYACCDIGQEVARRDAGHSAGVPARGSKPYACNNGVCLGSAKYAVRVYALQIGKR